MRTCFLITLIIIGMQSCSRPKALFYFDAEAAPSANDAVRFFNSSTKAETYTWDFGDGKFSSEVSPTHTFKKSGTYTVTLTAQRGSKNNKYTSSISVLSPEQCLVEIETTMGSMTALLYDDTYLHRDNFLKLTEASFFTDLLFHRVIPGFMIQSGDPSSKNAPEGKRLGGGGPSYTLPAEINDSLVHIKGSLCAARMSDDLNPEKRSSGSQFYIVHGRPIAADFFEKNQDKYNLPLHLKNLYLSKGGAPQLDYEYTVFGKVIDGLDVLDKIATSPTDENDRPQSNIKIIKVTTIK